MTNDVANVAAVLIERHECHTARERIIEHEGQNDRGTVGSDSNLVALAHAESLRITWMQVHGCFACETCQ